jgi:hypothetical protein
MLSYRYEIFIWRKLRRYTTLFGVFKNTKSMLGGNTHLGIYGFGDFKNLGDL